MGQGIQGLLKMQHTVDLKNEGIIIPTQVLYLANLHSMRERRQHGEIGACSIVFVLNGSMVEMILVKMCIKLVGAWN
jgi:hypothetical protein